MDQIDYIRKLTFKRELMFLGEFLDFMDRWIPHIHVDPNTMHGEHPKISNTVEVRIVPTRIKKLKPRLNLSPEEKKRRMKEYQRAYREAHK